MLKRSLIFVHRWLGVALCTIFLLWFPSGIGIMYWDFPSVTAADRLGRSAVLDPSKVVLSPDEAFAKLAGMPPPSALLLNTYDGRPTYRFRFGTDEVTLYADTGDEAGAVSKEMMERIVSAWTGQPVSTATATLVEEVDQWTVQVPIDDLAPVWKYSWPNGEQVYFSQISGDVVQYTTTASRFGAWVGAIPHWLYFTPLRSRGETWSRIVIWSSGIGTFSAILGVVIGVWMYSPSKRYRYAGARTAIPYRGQKRWHAIIGLVFGIATATWAFSGMLSMDPFPTPTSADESPSGRDFPQALRGSLDYGAFAARHPREALAAIPDLPVKELELTSFAGRPLYLATLADGDTRIVPLAGAARTEFDRQEVIGVVTKAAQPDGLAEIRVLDQYDRYYLDRRRERPLPVILATLNDTEHSRYYIDPKTGRVAGTYKSSGWVTRWVYHGLHSLNFPWLYNYRPLWDIVVITFMLGGTALAVTSLIMVWRVLGRKLARKLGTSEDLLPEA